MNVRIFWVRAMKCMYAQTRPRFKLSSEGVLGGMEFEPMLTPREKSPLPKMCPEEDRTRDAVDSEPKHYQLSYSGPSWTFSFCRRQMQAHEAASADTGYVLPVDRTLNNQNKERKNKQINEQTDRQKANTQN